MQSYMKQHQAAWTLGNRHQFISCLTTYALPTLGKLSVADIGTPHVLQVLEPIWETKTVTAQRVRSRIESILAWATVSNFRSGPNPATWKNHVDKLLAKPGDIRKVKHVPALPYGQMQIRLRAQRLCERLLREKHKAIKWLKENHPDVARQIEDEDA
jgi:hypothetical protein